MDSFAGNVQAPPTFNMPGMNSAANSAAGGIGNLQNTFGGLGGSILPQAGQTANNLYNNPFAGQGLAGAQGAAQLGQMGAMTGFGTGASMVPYAQQIFQQGMDPQNALYGRTLQQVQDQSRVGQAARGINMTPYGAGLEDQATSNFNIDWQNNQLQRMMGAGQAGGALAGQGVNMMNQAPGQMVQSAMLPYATYSDIGQGQNQALSSLLGLGGQGANLSNMPIQDWMGYLGVGNQAGGVANQNFANQLQQSNLGWNQMGQLGSGLGSMLSMFL